MAVDESKLNVFMQNFVQDIGAVMHAAHQHFSLTEEQARLAPGLRATETPFNLIFEARP